MSSSALAPGVIVADTYEIERQLGVGGMGEVWLAKHRRLAGKQVAVKVLRLAGEVPAEALARFRHEAEIAARLEHPNIVQVLDFNALPSGEPFLVMEYLKGHSLAERLRQGPMAVEPLLDLVRQVGAALQAAHEAGVVHRDLKPENIFLVPTALGDQVKVLDFGISKLSHSQTVQTTDSVLIGTPLYMSPEQALGNNRDVSAQSDVFSLGSITYEALTGTAPFFADNVARVVFRIAYEKHRPLTEVRPDLPPELVGAVEHALAKDKAQRTPDMATFVAEVSGRALAPTPQASSDSGPGGVYTPAVGFSETLASGATIARGSQPRGEPAPVQASSPAAPVQSRRGVLLPGVIGAVVLVAAGLWLAQGRAVEASGVADAGVVVVAAVDARDAGEPDAGGPDAGEVAALGGVPEQPFDEPTRDAGVTKPSGRPSGRVDPSGPVSASERSYLAGLSQQVAAGEDTAVLRQRNQVRTLKSPRARFEGLQLLIRAACHRRDDTTLTTFVRELRRVASRSTFNEARDECLRQWPEASLRWEE